MQLRSLATATTLLLALQAVPCINDRDTLAEEARALNASMKDQEVGLIQVLSARFERNPPLYYQMRIERVKRELATDPSQIELYDDIAAAYDRIGESGEALVWIEKKRELLEKQGPMTEANKEQWYRYWANAGTFRAHKYLKDGAKPEQKSELQTAAQIIEKAIEIKPDAHFGREKAQLEVMRWLLKGSPKHEGLGEFLLQSMERDDIIEGLGGLIRLGNAWQSPDVHDALASALQRPRQREVSQFAWYRTAELIESGAEPMGSLKSVGDSPRRDANLGGETASEFRRLREEADEWHKSREAFMLARLNEGKHPDTHNDFWEGYVEAAAPQPRDTMSSKGGVTSLVLFGIGGSLLVLAGFLVVKRLVL